MRWTQISLHEWPSPPPYTFFQIFPSSQCKDSALEFCSWIDVVCSEVAASLVAYLGSIVVKEWMLKVSKNYNSRYLLLVSKFCQIQTSSFLMQGPHQDCEKIKLSQGNHMAISPKGARILELVLNGVTVIEGLEPYYDLGSGNYLMYPWVSRLEKEQAPYSTPIFKDGNGIAIHGMALNLPMKLSVTKHEHSIKVTARPVELIPAQLPDFTQVFTLEPNKLTIHLEVNGKSHLPICFGYHPYFQINHEKLADLHIETNLKNNLKLDQKTLLPIVPLIESNVEIMSTKKYDHLFKNNGEGEAFFRLCKPHGHSVEVKSIDMKYWQVYTPPDGVRIAVEPMTFFGNMYALYSQQKFGKLPTKGTFSIEVK